MKTEYRFNVTVERLEDEGYDDSVRITVDDGTDRETVSMTLYRVLNPYRMRGWVAGAADRFFLRRGLERMMEDGEKDADEFDNEQGLYIDYKH